MRKVLKIVLMVLAAIAVVAVIILMLNFTYLKRVTTFFEDDRIRKVDWFEPTVELAPSSSERFSVPDKLSNASENRFAKAIDFAESTGTSAFLIWHRGELILEKYSPGYDANSYTQTASLHKSLLSLLVGVAIDEGAIESVKDPVSKYLGDWIKQPHGQITIEHLLTMTSGLGKEKAKFGLLDHSLQLLHATNISAVSQSLPQRSAPGESFDYINTNPQLLVGVLEAATGRSYEDYLSEKIWSKIAASPGYLWLDREEGAPHGYCCLISRPGDLLRIGLLYLQRGDWQGEQLVSRSWIADATAASKVNPNYGYLVWRGSPYNAVRTYTEGGQFGMPHSEPYLADDVLFFDGFGGQRVYIIPSRELVIVRVGESKFNFDDAILPNRVMEALADEQSVSGSYKVGHADLTIKAEHNDRLPIRVAYPIGAERANLIVFSHGNFLDASSYDLLIDTWAAQGYLVVAPTHLDAGGMQAGTAAREKYGSDWLSAARLLDMQEGINQIGLISTSLDGFYGHVNADKVIAAGHSYGALTAQRMAGAAIELLGDSLYPMPDNLIDNRVNAVVAISPPGLIPGYLSEKTWVNFDAPQLVITGTKDVSPPFWSEYEEHLVSYESAREGQNYLLVLDGMDHYMGNVIGRLDRDEDAQLQSLKNVADVSMLFIRAYMESSSTAVDELDDAAIVSARLGVARYEKR